MTPTERRNALIRLLANIDQDEQEAHSIVADSAKPLSMRRRARVYLEYFRRTAARTEQLLAAMDNAA